MKTNKLYTLMTIIIILALCVATIQFVKADSKTIFVPDDYPTISAAVAKASDGDTIFVENGTYNEPSLEIDKSIRLIGEDKNNTVIILHSTPYNKTFDHGPFGVPITLTFWENILTITAPNVTLSGFTIKCQNNKGGEISLTGDGTKLIDNKIDWSISGTGNRIQIINNSFAKDVGLSGSNLTIAQNIVGGAIYCQGSYNVIISNTVRKPDEAISMDNDIYGPWLSISVGSFGIVVDNRINAGGLALSGNGSVAAKNIVRSSVWVNGSDNTVCANNVTHGGLIVTGNNNTFYANNIAGYTRNNSRDYELHKAALDSIQGAPYALSIGRSYEAVLFRISGENYANNTFFQNNFSGSTLLRLWDGVYGPNFWNNAQQGNYWSNYNGTDANHDGIGDTPYTIDTRNREYLPLNNTGIQDSYPLIAPFNETTVGIELPAWATALVSSLVLPISLPEHVSTETSQPIPTVYIAAALGASTSVIGTILLFYFKKHRH
ncbi:hypothetical protein MUO79_09860 [Candidatus Bathyarchaeota archaeon]|nr:hypothetical protein [Candidatus Bathyarchaeota archaeon]